MLKSSHILINDRIQMELKKKLIYTQSHVLFHLPSWYQTFRKNVLFLEHKKGTIDPRSLGYISLTLSFLWWGGMPHSVASFSNSKRILWEGCQIRGQWFFSHMCLNQLCCSRFPLTPRQTLMLSQHLAGIWLLFFGLPNPSPFLPPTQQLNIWISASPFLSCCGVI